MLQLILSPIFPSASYVHVRLQTLSYLLPVLTTVLKNSEELFKATGSSVPVQASAAWSNPAVDQEAGRFSRGP